MIFVIFFDMKQPKKANREKKKELFDSSDDYNQAIENVKSTVIYFYYYIALFRGGKMCQSSSYVNYS